jgi:hypothetical protein
LLEPLGYICKNLKNVSLINVAITDEMLKTLANSSPNVEELHLRCTQLSPKYPECIVGLTKLRDLAVWEVAEPSLDDVETMLKALNCLEKAIFPLKNSRALFLFENYCTNIVTIKSNAVNVST